MYNISSQAIWRNNKDRIFIFYKNYAMLMKDIGAEIWLLINEGYDDNAMADILFERYSNVDYETLKKDISDFLRGLEKIGLITLNSKEFLDLDIKANIENFKEMTDPYNISSVRIGEQIDFLYKVVFELTYSCNNKCKYCYNGEIRHENLLELEKLKEIIDEAKDLGAMDLSITGGEPLLRKECFELLKYGHKNNFNLVLQTNGTLIDDTLAKKLSKLMPITVAITMHSHDKKIHDNFAGRAGAFDEAVAGIRNLRKYGIPTSIRYVLTKLNKDGIEEYNNFSKKLDVGVTRSPLIFPTSDGIQDPFQYELDFNDKLDIVKKNAYLPRRDICGAGKIKVIISPNGKVYPCTFYHKEIGDITKESLIEILEKPKTKRIQKYFEQPQVCKDCDNSDFCPRCPILCMSKKGSFSSILESDCNMAVECKKEVILNYAKG